MNKAAKIFAAIASFSMFMATPVFAQVGIFTGGGDIGPVGMAGSASVNGDVYTLSGSGADIWGSADEMHYIYFEASGAFSFKVDDVLVNVGTGDAEWTKAGLMIRDNDTPGSPNGFSMIHGNEQSFRPQVRRSQDGGSSGLDPDVEAFIFFGKIEIERIGNRINFIYTDDFTGERVLHSSAVVDQLEDPVLVGLAVTSHNNSGISEAVFTNPTFTQYDAAFLTSRNMPFKFPNGGGTIEGVELTLEVIDGTPDVTVTETAPEGWTISNVQTNVGTASASGNVLTWEVPSASGNPVVTYDVTPSAGASEGTWGDSGATDGTLTSITGGIGTVFEDQFPSDFFPLMKEDFEELPLGPYIWESDSGPEVWTDVPPTGWTIDNSNVPGYNDDVGAPEWRGWTFSNKDAWNSVAGDQRRSEYVLGQGTVMIADPDEWDDRGDNGDPDSLGLYGTYVSTQTLDIPAGASQIAIAFDSSWRPEDDQLASLDITFDGSTTERVLFWESDPSHPDYKDDNSTNEPLLYMVDVPSGASTFFLTFGMPEATNDWWWAIDNLVVGTDVAPAQVVVSLPFSEDFEGVALGDSVEEEVPGTGVWSNQAPTGWSVDNTGVVGAADGLGVDEWIGWTFANKDWWVQTAGDQRRSEFALGEGTVAIADPDEWDDIDSPGNQGVFTSFLRTPIIETGGASAVELTFDSSWRDEDTQATNITVVFDGGAPVEVLRWSSDPNDPNFHDDFPNETVVVPVEIPSGAQTMVVSFGMLDATNDWWWAIDNISIAVPTSVNEWALY